MTALTYRLLLTAWLCVCGQALSPLVAYAEKAMHIDDSVSWAREHRGDNYAIYSKTVSNVITPYIYGEHLSFVDGIAAESVPNFV